MSLASLGPQHLLALLRSDGPALARLARRLVGAGEAEDVVQEALARALASPAQRVEQPRAFLYRAVVTAALDLGRRRRVREPRTAPAEQAATLPCPGASPDLAAGSALELARVRDALDELPAACRHAFLLSRMDGVPREEIARRLGVSVKTVERQIQRALRHCLERVER
jgi:RNA polymerase sigma-70 factor (ECF subfamily)